jgi:osmotically-inducible protein OsmY
MRKDMNGSWKLLAGLGIGAAIMYFLDPQRGHARRTQARDQAAAAVRDAKWELETTRRDLRNRVRGKLAERRHADEEFVSDIQLVERVRAELGHNLESLHGLEITASNGIITVGGSLTADQRDRILSVVRKVRGVRQVQELAGSQASHVMDE